jgi:hypothetical protein
MTLAEAIATPIKQRRSSRHAALLRSPLEDLVVELQSRADFQSNDHAALSSLIISDRGREAVEDRNFASARDNLRHAITHGRTEDQLKALDRLTTVHDRDEAAEDRLLHGLLSLLGVHNADLNDLRRMMRDNARAITHGDPVRLSEYDGFGGDAA